MSKQLPDDTMQLDGQLVRLVERELITIWRPIGKDGAWVPIRFVQSRAVQSTAVPA